jgi:hypothetical protein
MNKILAFVLCLIISTIKSAKIRQIVKTGQVQAQSGIQGGGVYNNFVGPLGVNPLGGTHAYPYSVGTWPYYRRPWVDARRWRGLNRFY